MKVICGKKIHNSQEARQRASRFLTGILAPILLTLALSTSAFAQVEPDPLLPPEMDTTTETLQDQLPDISVEEKNSVLKFKVSDKVTYEIFAEPDVQKMMQSLGLSETNPLKGYESLSPEEQAKFKSTRIEFLKNAAKTFQKIKYVAGVGSLIGRSFSFIYKKIRGRKIEDSEPISFQHRSTKITQNMLQALDYKLWTQAPLVIASNEFGFSIAVGLSATRGYHERGAGGTEEVGINLGFNKESKAFVFEIFHSSETFKNSPMPIGVVGLPYKVGPFMAHKIKGAEVTNMAGETFYPPFIPGFSTTSSNYFLSGFSSSLSIPPSPIVDMLTFTNDFDRRSLLRITVSPILRGFIRVQFGDLKGSIVVVTTRVINVVKTVALKVHETTLSKFRNQCQSVFN